MKTLCISFLTRALILVPFFLSTNSPAQDEFNLASEIMKRVQLQRGICSVLSAGDNKLPLAMARASEMLIHVIDPDAGTVRDLRKRADEAGYPIQRITVEQGSLKVLPYATNTVDLLVGANSGITQTISVGEILRSLRPEGIAIVTGTNADSLRKWAGKLPSTSIWKNSHGTWLQFSKPVPKGLDDWSHWEKSPDNNPVSTDSQIKAPYMTQFMAKPYYIGMPAITTVAGGRTFLAMGHIAHHEREWNMLNRLIARNGYNGTVLWERKFPDDYLVHRSAFVATKETFYMIDGDHCLMLDAASGEEKGKIQIPGFKGDWKWMAIVGDVLYALAGAPGDGVELVKGNRAMGGWSWSDLSKGYYPKRIPHGFGDQLVAYDLKQKTPIWKHQEETLIDSRGLAISGEKMFVYCPDRHFRCINRETGKTLWTNKEKLTLELIEQPGKGLTSTPGWRTQSMVVATPKSLVVQGQTRMNVIGISTEDGSMLWQKSKVTNNPNAIYADGKVILGVGEKGKHIVIDPVTGTVEEELNFYKRACTRLTASTDSLFCRGEGMTRFDLETREVTVDGTVRPACNDGVIPANGLLYLGPWACDCNLSLIGNVARCSAGDFSFAFKATNEENLTLTPDTPSTGKTVSLKTDSKDWWTYRGNNQRSAATEVAIKGGIKERWQFQPDRSFVPTDATTAGGLIFSAGDDGKIRAIDASNGEQRWSFGTAGIIKYPPTIQDGRAWIGSGDGNVYCLEAATGRLLWKFRAAPAERKIMVYGSLTSTWPVNTGVLVHEGTAYFGAGIIDHDGTCVYALDATSGKILWQNNKTGHLNLELRKGISPQGNLTISDGKLTLAGGNVISPARFDLATGECLEEAKPQGQPQANGGRFVGVIGDDTIIAGGRILYSSPRNVSTKGSFTVWSADRKQQTLNFGGIPPAWNSDALAVANFKYGRITVFNSSELKDRVNKGFEKMSGHHFNRTVVATLTNRSLERWQSNLGDSDKFEPLSLAITGNYIITVARYQDIRRTTPQWFMTGLDPKSGAKVFELELPGEPLPGGLAVDRNGQVIVTLLDGGLVCFAGE